MPNLSIGAPVAVQQHTVDDVQVINVIGCRSAIRVREYDERSCLLFDELEVRRIGVVGERLHDQHDFIEVSDPFIRERHERVILRVSSARQR